MTKMEHPVLTAPPLVARRNEIEPTCCVNSEKLCQPFYFETQDSLTPTFGRFPSDHSTLQEMKPAFYRGVTESCSRSGVSGCRYR